MNEIWKYEKQTRGHIIKIHENGSGILFIENKGIAYLDGCEKAFNFIIEYAQEKNIKVTCLLDNTKLNMIDSSVKLLFLRFQEANLCIEKIAVIGNNYFIKHFGKIHQHTCHFQYQIRSFREKEIAISWLNNDKE